MSDFYFITGFLGSGKTTYIKNFITFFSDKKIAIIVNEFGKTGIDGKLLSHLNAEISEITNGSILCSCRIFDFEETLKKVLQQRPDVILVEASGLTDPTTIKKFLCTDHFSQSIDYKGCICLVDAGNFEKVFTTAVVCKKQLLSSDIVIINKIDLVTESKKTALYQTIKGCSPDIEIIYSEFARIDNSIFTLLDKATQNNSDKITSRSITADITVKKFQLTLSKTIPIEQLQKLVELLSSESYRIKGFIRLEERTYVIDCVQNIVSITDFFDTTESELLQKIVILSGKGMNTTAIISQAQNLYSEFIENIEYN